MSSQKVRASRRYGWIYEEGRLFVTQLNYAWSAIEGRHLELRQVQKHLNAEAAARHAERVLGGEVELSCTPFGFRIAEVRRG